MCRQGDLPGVQAALSGRGMTPFVLDEHGFTALHWAAQGASSGVCSWLIKQGVDPNRREDYGRKAVQALSRSLNNIGNGDFRMSDVLFFGIEALIDTLRIFGQAQEELFALDVMEMWYLYRGSAQDAEMLYQLCSGFMEFQEEDFKLMQSHLLIKALWEYGRGRGPRAWGNLIRKLVRKRVDIHGRVCDAEISEPEVHYLKSGERNTTPNPKRHRVYGTPLDELFKHTTSSIDAESVADNWLYMLWSEGYDDRAYLKKEFEIHTEHHQLTYSGHPGTTRRQLVFYFGEEPNVSWEWLISPNSGGCLVREEFKTIETLWDDFDDLETHDNPELDVWPFDFPDWSLERMPNVHRPEAIPLDYIHLRLDAEERLKRRWRKKKAKEARARRTKGPRKIPGAWPT